MKVLVSHCLHHECIWLYSWVWQQNCSHWPGYWSDKCIPTCNPSSHFSCLYVCPQLWYWCAALQPDGTSLSRESSPGKMPGNTARYNVNLVFRKMWLKHAAGLWKYWRGYAMWKSNLKGSRCVAYSSWSESRPHFKLLNYPFNYTVVKFKVALCSELFKLSQTS